MTDTAQDNAVNESSPPLDMTPHQQIEMMRNSMINAGFNQYQAYKNFIRSLPLDPHLLAALVQKLDDTWVWARVSVTDMQINLPAA